MMDGSPLRPIKTHASHDHQGRGGLKTGTPWLSTRVQSARAFSQVLERIVREGPCEN